MDNCRLTTVCATGVPLQADRPTRAGSVGGHYSLVHAIRLFHLYGSRSSSLNVLYIVICLSIAEKVDVFWRSCMIYGDVNPFLP